MDPCNGPSRKTKVFKSKIDKLWTIEWYASPWAMVPKYLKYSSYEDALFAVRYL